MRCRPRTPGCARAWPRLFDGKLEGFFARIGGVLDALDHGRRHRDARHIGVHELERPRAGDEADRGQERRVLEQADARPLGAERLELRGLVTDLQLQEARARARLLERALRAVGQRRRARVLDGADEEVRRGLDLAAREVLAARQIAAAVTMTWGPSRSNTRRASCSSPAVTSSPVRQEMFSMPCSAAPTMSAWIARRFLSRQTTCMIGSTPSIFSAMATARLEACACAAVLSVALTASTQGAYCSSLRAHRVQAAAVDDRQLPRDHEAARRPACARARTCASRRLRASSRRASGGRAC